jgi:hypothetical protein
MKTAPKISKANRVRKPVRNVAQSCNISNGKASGIEGWFTPFGDSRQSNISLGFCFPANK